MTLVYYFDILRNFSVCIDIIVRLRKKTNRNGKDILDQKSEFFSYKIMLDQQK